MIEGYPYDLGNRPIWNIRSEPRRSQQADEIRSRFQREAGGRQRHRTRMR